MVWWAMKFLSMFFCVSLVGVFGFHELRADDLQSGETGLMTPSNSESLMNWTADSIVLGFLLLVVGMIAWSIFSNWSTNSKLSSVGFSRLVKGPTAQNLFLGMRFRIAGQPSMELVGYVRSIDTHWVSLVVDGHFRKGQSLDLILSSLPDFPLEKAIARARIVSISRMQGDLSSFLLKLKFESEDPDMVRKLVAEYIYQLSKPRTVLQHV